MKDQYIISGIKCNSCVKKVEHVLKESSQLSSFSIDRENQLISFDSDAKIDLKPINLALDKIGNYKISSSIVNYELQEKTTNNWFIIYKPLIIIIAFIIGLVSMVQYPFESFSISNWSRHFMAGFFIVFSFFKLLDLQGFKSSYQMYNLIAKKWKSWGYFYPFLELLLGLLYLTDEFPVYTNIATVILLGISLISVVISNFKKQKIQCACLGSVFKLPMSLVTVIEDSTMVLMAIIMLIR